MKNFDRKYPYFALCGLNCGLCPIHHMANGCPGCGGGEGQQSCAIARCSLEHGQPEYCFQCASYPCQKFDGISEFDSFLPTRNRQADFLRAQAMGLEAYQSMLDEKTAILEHLLTCYNDGRRKTFFCTAVNLLELCDIKAAMEQIDARTPQEAALQVRASIAVETFQSLAAQRGVSLKLRRKPRKKS